VVNLPNALTISRLVAIPPLIFLLLADFPNHDQIAAAVADVFLHYRVATYLLMPSLAVTAPGNR